jgi:twitching motility protein PilT
MTPEQVLSFLTFGKQQGASDIHFKVGEPPCFRVNGSVIPLKAEKITHKDSIVICQTLVNDPEVKQRIETLKDYDGSFEIKDVARFRVNIYRQQGQLAVVLRIINAKIPPLESLGLPPLVKKIAEFERGLILVTGATGSGKTTTLASMINHINLTRKVHILTIEDPIEVIYQKGLATISQREIGSDTLNFAQALRAALRQDPDVILVGEMRDIETIDIGLKAAETGHLVFATVHTTDATRTIGRLLSVFPPEAQSTVRLRLADALKATISQRLLPKLDGKGRALAAEVMQVTALIQECIRDSQKTGSMKDVIFQGKTNYGMQTFDQHLSELYSKSVITKEVALEAATSPSDLLRQLNLDSNTPESKIEINRE